MPLQASKRTHAVEAICDQFRELFAAALTPDIVRMLTALRVACIRDAELLGLVEERILASRDMVCSIATTCDEIVANCLVPQLSK